MYKLAEERKSYSLNKKSISEAGLVAYLNKTFNVKPEDHQLDMEDVYHLIETLPEGNPLRTFLEKSLVQIEIESNEPKENLAESTPTSESKPATKDGLEESFTDGESDENPQENIDNVDKKASSTNGKLVEAWNKIAHLGVKYIRSAGKFINDGLNQENKLNNFRDNKPGTEVSFEIEEDGIVTLPNGNKVSYSAYKESIKNEPNYNELIIDNAPIKIVKNGETIGHLHVDSYINDYTVEQ